MDMRDSTILALMRMSYITVQMHRVAKTPIITGLGEDGSPQKGILHKWIMRAERAQYGATELMCRPTAIILP